MTKLKIYIPDGHLESKTLELFKGAGFDIKISKRSYNPTIDDPDLMLKRIRPQDFPFVISIGKGDMGITGSDILEEFSLENPMLAKNLVELLDLKLGATKLSVSVSMDVYPKVKTIKDFKKYVKKNGIIVATEYPAIAKKYLKKNGINAIIQKPAGKTEAWVVPPMPEADLIVDTTETGRTLEENRCRVIDIVNEASARIIANKKSLKDTKKRKKIEEIVKLIEGVIRAKDKVNVCLNVINPKDLTAVLKTLKRYVNRPTISELMGGGYDIFVVINEADLRYMLPDMVDKGATSVVVSDTRMLI